MGLTRREFLTRVVALPVPVLLSRGADADAGFTFGQLCDPQLGMGGYEHDIATFRQAVTDLNRLRPDFVVICGDLVHETGSDQAFADFNDIKSGFEMPCHCAAGNHDIGGQPTAALLSRYRKLIGPDWYTVEHKGCTFIIVNTQLWKSPVPEETDRQDGWLLEVLNRARERSSPAFIVGHYPLYLEDPLEEEEYFNLPVSRRKELLGLYMKSNVAAVLAGHTHRNVVKDHAPEGPAATGGPIQLVASATTSRNFDGAPMGFRVWRVGARRPYPHEYVSLSVDIPAPEPV